MCGKTTFMKTAQSLAEPKSDRSLVACSRSRLRTTGQRPSLTAYCRLPRKGVDLAAAALLLFPDHPRPHPGHHQIGQLHQVEPGLTLMTRSELVGDGFLSGGRGPATWAGWRTRFAHRTATPWARIQPVVLPRWMREHTPISEQRHERLHQQLTKPSCGLAGNRPTRMGSPNPY